VLQPVFGDISVNKRIGDHSREANQKDQTQDQTGASGQNKKPQIPTDEFEHAWNIPCFEGFPIIPALTFLKAGSAILTASNPYSHWFEV
jgi:hypothetical protein